MHLNYISRNQYREKDNPEFLNRIQKKEGPYFIIPEGGSNVLAVKGCRDIVKNLPANYDFLAVSCGTGGTIAGVVAGNIYKSQVLGFPVLKGGHFLKSAIEELLYSFDGRRYENWQLMDGYHFGGYAKFDPSLINFINKFKNNHEILLDPIYTGKMMFGIYDLVKKGFFPRGSKILAIHTGGTQGIRGFNARFGNIVKG